MRTDWRPCESGLNSHPCERWEDGLYTEDQCLICWKYHTDPKYKKLWNGPKPLYTAYPTFCQLWLYRFKITIQKWFPWYIWHIKVIRARRFIIAVSRHIAGGLPTTVSSDVVFRRAICQPCIWRNTNTDECSQCGCNLGGEKKLISKIAWAREQCPLFDPEVRPGEYWGPVQGETIWVRLWRRVVTWSRDRYYAPPLS